MNVMRSAERREEQKTVLETTGPAQRPATREIVQLNVMMWEERRDGEKAMLEMTGPAQRPMMRKIVQMSGQKATRTKTTDRREAI